MAVKTKEEIMSILRDYVGEDTGDNALGLIQDISDTLDNSGAERISQLEQQVKDTDENWRKKYRDTFFAGKPDPQEEEEKPKKPRTFEDLFTTN